MSDGPTEIVVRHVHQVALWPLQLMPLRPGEQVQRHWEAFDAMPVPHQWRELRDRFGGDPGEFQERHYREFVTFLPYVQRFLYGASAGQETSRHREPSMRVFRRTDVALARLSFADGEVVDFRIAHVDLYFFLDADIAILAFGMHANDLPLARAQDALFRFGRAYPGSWDDAGCGGNCLQRVEWLDQSGKVLARSDYENRAKFLEHVAQHRSPCIASHWEFLLRPLELEKPECKALLRYRLLEYYRMPMMAYVAVDEPTSLSRGDFVRLCLLTRPDDRDALPFSARSLEKFEEQYCDDRFWGRAGSNSSGDTRLMCTANALTVVGRHGDAFFAGADRGMLGMFRHQYFLLFLIAHFHKAALLSMSDELAVAMNRLDIADTESVRRFKRAIRQAMEIFLRFTHRYWFHEVTNQPLARSIFQRLTQQLGTDALYEEVRCEVADMNNYLDTDSVRRQANTILRLTVVTIFGLIGTVATGFLGMNLLAHADQPMGRRVIFFIAVLGITSALTVFTIVKSRRLADFLDALSDERVSWGGKWQSLVRAFWRT
jgi:hypothetical protein